MKHMKGRASAGGGRNQPHKQDRTDKAVPAKAKASALRDKGVPKMKARRRGDVEA